MTCRETQENLSLYLYGELDAAAEEAVEQHLHDCSACAEALAQESVWHEALNASEAPLPLELLSQCRRDLHEEFQVIRESSQPRWMKWIAALGLSPSPWSARLAMASMLVCLGFGLSQLLMHHGLPGDAVSFGGVDQAGEMGLVNPVQRRVRMIQPVEGNNVQIVFDEIHERVVAGSCDDARIRRLLLAAAKDPADPGLRVDSIEVLKDQSGSDVQNILLEAVEHDPSAGVRLKALDGLRRFTDEAQTRAAIAYVLSHDDNPQVRTQAINVLLPSPGSIVNSPQLAGTLQEVMRNEQDGYIRMRCQRALRVMNVSTEIY